MSTETNEYSFDVGSPAELVVKNIRGLVNIKPGEDGVIKITETRHLDDGYADQTAIEVSQDASGRVKASVRMLDSFFNFNIRKPLRVDFEIEAPAKTNLKVKVVSGEIAVSGLSGQIYLKTVSGSQHLQDLSGDLDLASVSGSITGTNLSGEAQVDVVSGRLDLRGCDFPNLRAKVVSGKALVETKFGEGPYNLDAVSGTLTLVVPEDTNCQVSATAVSGRFKTDLNVSQSSVGRRHWDVKIGEGGVPVRMKTVSGKMQLLSSFDAVGKSPGNVRMSRKQREKILTRLSEGEIDVDQAVQELGG